MGVLHLAAIGLNALWQLSDLLGSWRLLVVWLATGVALAVLLLHLAHKGLWEPLRLRWHPLTSHLSKWHRWEEGHLHQLVVRIRWHLSTVVKVLEKLSRHHGHLLTTTILEHELWREEVLHISSGAHRHMRIRPLHHWSRLTHLILLLIKHPLIVLKLGILHHLLLLRLKITIIGL